MLFRSAREKSRTSKNVEQSLSRDLQTCIEVAVDYGNAGFYSEAVDILSVLTHKSKYPMVYYYLGFYTRFTGNREKSLDYFRMASQMPLEYCFPFRLESIDVLQAAIADNPSDGRAHYYLGNFWYDNEPANAISHWQEAARLDPVKIGRASCRERVYI